MMEILYAYASGFANNGSAMDSLHANTPYYNLTMAFGMLTGRVLTLIPALAIAGSLVLKKVNPPVARFPTASTIFIVILAMVVVIVGALTFLSVFVLGPILEHVSILAGKTF